MRLILALFALVVMPLSAFAQSVSTNFSTKSNGVLRFALVGKDFCESDSFSVRVVDRNAGKSEIYTAKSGNKNWRINKDCGFNQEFSHELLKPGMVLNVVTFRGNVQTRSLWAAVPCYTSIEQIQVRDLRFSLTEITTGISCDNGNYVKETGSTVVVAESKPKVSTTTVVVVPVQETRLNYCSITKKTNEDFVTINAVCDRSEVASILVTANNQILCRKGSAILGDQSTGAQTICVVPRNNTQTINLRIEVQTDTINQVENFSIAKNPTFTSLPVGKILTPVRQSVKKENKALGRGNYWTTNISAKIVDRDSDNNDIVIKTQLIEVTANGERVLDTRNTSSGGTVNYSLEHQYITPILFGSDRHEGALTVGQDNTLKIRVYDAYSETRFVDLQPMTIHLER